MAVTQEKLLFQVEINAKDAEKATKDLEKAVDSLGGTMKETGKKADGLLSSFGVLASGAVVLNQAWELTKRVIAKIGTIMGATVGEAIKLETQVARISTLFENSSQSTVNFSEEILKLQRTFGGTTENIGAAFYEAIASGAVSATGSVTLLAEANKLAIGGMTDLKTATDALSGTIMAYNMEATDAARINDILFIGARDGKTSVAELAKEMGVAVNIAANMGVTFDELVAAVSTVTSAGVSTAEAVTSVRSAIVALARQTAPLTILLNQMGIKSIQAKLKADGLVNTIREIKAKAGGSAEAMVKLMERIEAFAAVSALTSKGLGGKFDSMYKSIKDASTNVGKATGDAVEKMMSTTQKRVEIALANIQEVFTRFGQLFLVATAPVLEFFGKLAVSASQAARDVQKAIANSDFTPLKKSIDTAGEKLLTFGLAAGTVMVAFAALDFGKFVAFFAMLDKLTKAVFVFAATTIHITAVVVAVAAVALAFDYLVRNSHRLGEAFGAVFMRMELSVLHLQEAWVAFTMRFGDWSPEKAKSLDEIGKKIDELRGKLNKKQEKLDMGLAGGLADSIASLFKDLPEQMSSTADQTKRAKKESEDFKNNLLTSKNALNSMITQFNAIIDKARQYGAAVEEHGKTEQEIAMMRADYELRSLWSITRKLDAERALTVEMRAQAVAAQDTLNQVMRINAARDRSKEFTKTLKENEEIQKKLDENGLSSLQNEMRKAQEQKKSTEEVAKQLNDEKIIATYESSILDTRKDQETSIKVMKEIQDKADLNQISNANALRRIRQLTMEMTLQTMKNTAKWLDQMKSGSIGVRDTMLDMWAQSKADQNELAKNRVLDNKELSEQQKKDQLDQLNAASAKLPVVAQIIKSVIDIFAQPPEEFKKWLDGILVYLRTWPNLIIANIPTFVHDIIAQIPQAVAEFFKFLAGSMDGLVSEVTMAAMGATNDVIKYFFTAKFWNEVVFGFFRAMRDQLYKIGDFIREILSGNFDFGKTLAKSIQKSLGPVLTGVSEDLFAVLDLAQQGKGMDAADKIAQSIKSSTNQAVAMLKMAWEALKQAFKWVWDNILNPFPGAVLSAFGFLTGIFDPVMIGMALMWDKISGGMDAAMAGLTIVWKNIYDSFLGPFLDGLSVTWAMIKSVMWDPMVESLYMIGDFFATVFDDPVGAISDLLTKMGNMTGETIAAIKQFMIDSTQTVINWGYAIIRGMRDALEATGDWLGNVGRKIGDGFMSLFDKDTWKNMGATIKGWFEDLFSAETWKKLGNTLKDVVTKAFDIDWESVGRKIEGLFSNMGTWFKKIFSFDGGGMQNVERFLGLDFPWVAFAQGGVVPGFAPMPGDNSKNDKIPAILSPGEIVVPRSVLENNKQLGPLLLEAMKGKKIEFAKRGFLSTVAKIIPKPKDILPVLVGLPPGTPTPPVPPVVEKAVEKVTEVVIPDEIRGLFDSISRFIPGIDILKLLTDPINVLKDAIRANLDVFKPYFMKMVHHGQEGGWVPGSGRGDKVPSMLEPGEFVLNRNAAASLGGATLSALNAGKFTGDRGAGSPISVTLNIKTEKPIDENFVKQKLIPVVKEELRRASLDGRRVLAPGGVR